jgi:hypothetical protein
MSVRSNSQISKFNWQDFFNLADEWHKTCVTQPSLKEARFRCVISRAYYSAWNSCKDYAESLKAIRAIPASGNSHDNIIQWFSRGNTPEHKAIASNLIRLKQSRVKADYYSSMRVSSPENAANDALYLANRVLNDLGGLDINQEN